MRTDRPDEEAEARTVNELTIEPQVLELELKADSKILSPSTAGFVFTDAKPLHCAEVTVPNNESSGKHVRLRIKPRTESWDDRWACWRKPARSTSMLSGAAAASAQDVWTPDSKEFVLYIQPRSTRTAIIDFQAISCRSVKSGRYGFDVEAIPLLGGAGGNEDMNLGRESVQAELRIKHPASEILNSLPSLYQEAMLDLRRDMAPEDEIPFFERYLIGFDDIVQPLRETIGRLEEMFGATSTPSALLIWLASWVAMPLNDNWPEMKRRLLIRSAVRLYQMRGTRTGLMLYLKIYTGTDPDIDDQPTSGMRLGKRAQLNTSGAVLGDISSFTFNVTVFEREDTPIKENLVREIIESYKPAHTAYRLQVVPKIL